MISETDLRETINSLLKGLVSSDFPFGTVADKLSAREEDGGIKLSPYGFIMWAVDHYGGKCTYANVLSSDNAVDGYVSAATKMRDDMPYMLLNANTYVTKILSNVADMDTCLRQLEGMTFPYVLYVLFAGSGQADVVERYRAAMAEQMRRYPSTLDKLPEVYRQVGQEVLDADA